MSKINVLVLNEPEPYGGVTWWRMYRPLVEMERMCPDLNIIWNKGFIPYQDIMRAHVCLAFRPSEPSQLQAIRQMLDFGLPVIADYDDDQLNIPTSHGDFMTLGLNAPVVKDCISLCAQLWVTTLHLAGVYHHHDIKVIPNAIFESDLPDGPNPVTNTVMYRGSAAYHYDVSVHEDWYYEIQEKAKTFYWIGYMPMFKHKHDGRIRFKPQLPLNQYFEFGRCAGINIVWKPMLDIPFCHSKSNIAMLEATMFGGVCLTNFAGAGEWKKAFRNLTFDPQRLKAGWKAAKTEILDGYRLEQTVEMRANAIRELAFK